VSTRTAFCLNVDSEIELPELPAGAGAPEIRVVRGYVPRLPSRLDQDGHGFWCTADEACTYYAGVGALLVRNGREIVVDVADGADPALVRLSILGPALGLALHQRGHLLLRASAVMIGGRAAAFVGGSGSGKSTLASVLHARGHPVIADDLVALPGGADPAVLLPGVPQLKLWPHTVTALGHVPDSLPRVQADNEKRALTVMDGFPERPVPLARIYVLAPGPHSAVSAIGPTEAVLELLRYWYCTRFGDELLRIGTTAADHLRQCGALAGSVEMRRLSRPRLNWSAAALGDLVEADLAG